MYTREEAARVAQALRLAEEYPLQVRTPDPRSFTVALSREAGSGGSLVGAEVARRLNWPLYDNELLTELARELQVDVHRLKGLDERPGSRLVECFEAFASALPLTELTYFRGLLKLILALGARGSCVIVGRGATIALPAETTLRVRVVAKRDDRITAIATDLKISRALAAKELDTRDRERAKFIRDHYHRDVNDLMMYDLVLNASSFSRDECATMVIEALEVMQTRKRTEHAARPVEVATH